MRCIDDKKIRTREKKGMEGEEEEERGRGGGGGGGDIAVNDVKKRK